MPKANKNFKINVSATSYQVKRSKSGYGGRRL